MGGREIEAESVSCSGTVKRGFEPRRREAKAGALDLLSPLLSSFVCWMLFETHPRC